MKNIIYKLINKNKELREDYPCYYIGSKMGYIPGKYWGSPSHPLLRKELKDDISSFEMIILEYVDKSTDLTMRENYWQKSVNAVENEKYYNLGYAKTNFSSAGFKWAYDPVSLIKGYFPKCKIPKGWALGKSPESLIRRQNKLALTTGLSKGDPNLNKIISSRTKENACRGERHRDIKTWTLLDPNGKIHQIIGLHEFCKANGLSATSLQYSINTQKPIKKGKSKGWCVLSKKQGAHAPCDLLGNKVDQTPEDQAARRRSSA